MYMTMFTANMREKESVKAYRLYKDRQKLHRCLCIAAGNQKREDINLLYDCFLDRDRIILYVQSLTEIKDEVPGFQKKDTIIIDSISQKLNTGSVLSFSLKTCPFKSQAGKKFYLANDSERMNWLARQGEKYGFSLMNAVETREEDIYFMHKEDCGGNGRQSVYKYNGALTITDGELFKKAFVSGIGRCKAYGLGLVKIGV